MNTAGVKFTCSLCGLPAEGGHICGHKNAPISVHLYPTLVYAHVREIDNVIIDRIAEAVARKLKKEEK